MAKGLGIHRSGDILLTRIGIDVIPAKAGIHINGAGGTAPVLYFLFLIFNLWF
jgi:hypothetical protein